MAKRRFEGLVSQKKPRGRPAHAEPTAFCFTEWNVQVRTFLMMSSTVSRRRVSVWMLLLMTLRE